MIAATVVCVVGAAVLVGITVVARGTGGEARVTEQPTAPSTGTPGRVFAVLRGDPVNVDLRKAKGGKRCIAISGEPYLSSRFCPPLRSIRASGAYTVMSPVEGDAPSLVLGFLPRARSRAAVTAEGSKALAESRGPLFLAVLAPGALGPAGDGAVRVEFG